MHAPLEPDERLLAVARAADGGLAVATDRALHHQHERSWARLGWEQVDQVRWDDPRHVLALTGLTPAVAARVPCCGWPAPGTCPQWPASVSPGPGWLTSACG